MARITFKKGDEYALRLSRLAAGSDEIAKKAIYKAADMVTDEIRAGLEGNLRDPEYVGKKGNALFKNMYSEPTGDLAASLGIAKIQTDKNGDINTKIGFDGYDVNGVPNQLKARAMESGTSVLKKRPFVRPAVNATKGKALDTMRRVIDEELEKIM
jgi:HK97 gp10 family phage protein